MSMGVGRRMAMPTVMVAVAVAVVGAAPLLEPLVVAPSTHECNHMGSTLTCYASHTSQDMHLKSSPPATVQKVFLYNARGLVIWPSVCVNISLSEVGGLKMQQGSAKVDESPSCPGMGLWFHNSRATQVPHYTTQVYADNSTLEDFSIRRLLGPMTIINSFIDYMEIDEVIVGQTLRFYGSRVKKLSHLRLGSGSQLSLQDSRLEDLRTGEVVAETGSSLSFKGDLGLNMNTQPIAIQPGVNFTIGGYSLFVQSQESNSPESLIYLTVILLSLLFSIILVVFGLALLLYSQRNRKKDRKCSEAKSDLHSEHEPKLKGDDTVESEDYSEIYSRPEPENYEAKFDKDDNATIFGRFTAGISDTFYGYVFPKSGNTSNETKPELPPGPPPNT